MAWKEDYVKLMCRYVSLSIAPWKYVKRFDVRLSVRVNLNEL